MLCAAAETEALTNRAEQEFRHNALMVKKEQEVSAKLTRDFVSVCDLILGCVRDRSCTCANFSQNKFHLPARV